jgi:hypothetical protein
VETTSKAYRDAAAIMRGTGHLGRQLRDRIAELLDKAGKAIEEQDWG